jgi:RNA polymerase sigma-70 factor (ECF subfamily)
MARVNQFEQLREQLLVLQYQAGDSTALTELVERYHGRLLYFLRRMLPDRQGAEDVLQDTWLTVIRDLFRLRQPKAFPAWLYRIARNKVYQQLRKHNGFVPLSQEVAEAPAEEETDDFSADDAARVHECLERLPPEQREVLVLRFVEQMSYDDIAAVVGCPPGTVRSRIHYGKRALRREMEGRRDEG